MRICCFGDFSGYIWRHGGGRVVWNGLGWQVNEMSVSSPFYHVFTHFFSVFSNLSPLQKFLAARRIIVTTSLRPFLFLRVCRGQSPQKRRPCPRMDPATGETNCYKPAKATLCKCRHLSEDT